MIKIVAHILILVAFISMYPLTSSSASGQEATNSNGPDPELKEVFSWLKAESIVTTSIATGSPAPLSRAPAVVTVITAEDIRAMGATTLDEALETVPGFHVSASPFVVNSPLYSIRGIHVDNNAQVLFMVNGIPFTQLYAGGRPYGVHLPVEAISRIEVIRGPGSALYGADAFAGVINIVTKSAQEIAGIKTGARAGSFDTYGGWAQYGGNIGGWDVALSLERQQTHGDSDRIVDADRQTMIDRILGTHASLAPGPIDSHCKIFDGHVELVRDRWTIRQWVAVVDDFGLGLGNTNIVTPDALGDGDAFLTDIAYRDTELAADWDFTMRLSYLQIDQHAFGPLFPPGAVLPIDSNGMVNFEHFVGLVYFPDGMLMDIDRTDRHAAMELTGFYTGFGDHSVRTGLGFRHMNEDTSARTNFGPGIIDGTQRVVDGDLKSSEAITSFRSRELGFAYVQDEWFFYRNWQMVTGARYDHYSDFGYTVNPRAGLIWEVRSDLTTKLLYGHAFRAPSFSELYNNPKGVVVGGNSSLEPETIRTLELAFDYRPIPRLRTVLSLFGYEAEGLIKPVQGPVGSVVYENAGDLEGYGFELEADWEVSRSVCIRSNLAWQHAVDKKTDAAAPDAPRLQFYVNPHWRFLPDWSIDGQFFWIGERKRAEGDTRSDIGDYTMVNLTVRRKNIARHWEVAFGVKNLFDVDAREPAPTVVPNDYPMPGIGFFGEVRYDF